MRTIIPLWIIDSSWDAGNYSKIISSKPEAA